MRRPSPYTDRREAIDLKMTPMIDVVFLLMIYFIWSSSFGVSELLMPSDVAPETSGAGTSPSTEPPLPIADFEKIIVRIVTGPGGVGWRVNDQPVASLADLQRQLQPIANIKRDAPVVLHPDPEVPLGDVIDVFDLARLLRFEKVQFAVNAK